MLMRYIALFGGITALGEEVGEPEHWSMVTAPQNHDRDGSRMDQMLVNDK